MLTNLCILATLLNPYHVRLYGVVVEYATQPGPFNLINELKALEFRGPYDWATLALAGAAAFALGRRKKLGSFEVMLLISSAYFSFRARRDLWFVVVAALAILAGGPRAAVAEAQRFRRTPLLRLTWAAALAALMAVVVWRQELSETRLQRTVAAVYPARAADFVIAQNCTGPVYNHLNWGGYLIWRWPHLPVAIDGRTNLHGEERLQRNDDTWDARPGWRDDPELEAANLVIGAPSLPLTALLRRDDRFALDLRGRSGRRVCAPAVICRARPRELWFQRNRVSPPPQGTPSDGRASRLEGRPQRRQPPPRRPSRRQLYQPHSGPRFHLADSHWRGNPADRRAADAGPLQLHHRRQSRVSDFEMAST